QTYIMRKLYFLLLALLAFANTFAQVIEPVSWSSRTEKLSETEFNLVFEAVIEKDWHVYSQFTPDGGPLPLTIDLQNSKGNFELIGKAKESATSRAYNDIFEVDEVFFANKATIKQRIKVLNANVTTINAVVEYQVCKEVCINGKERFTFKIPKLSAAAFQKAEPKDSNVSTPLVGDTVIATTEADTTSLQTKTDTVTQSPMDPPIVAQSGGSDPNRSLWTVFIIAFLSGFAALLMPCVFPLIPMTVSFFTKQSKTRAAGVRNAIIYGISIIVIYVSLGFLVSWIFGADALNSLATNVWFNLIFFLLLVIFAASFLGAFEIMLPNSWANKVDQQADRGGIIGILFMALALAIVSFSCTGIIVGDLLVIAASKGGMAPVIGMLCISLALAL